MVIQELLKHANKNQTKDLEALIMFLVFEKQVISLGDDSSKLDLFLLDKHKERMNKELINYKKKMNISKGMELYELYSKEFGRLYILAYSESQAKMLVARELFYADVVTVRDKDFMMNFNGDDITVDDLIKGRKIPEVLGGFHY